MKNMFSLKSYKISQRLVVVIVLMIMSILATTTYLMVEVERDMEDYSGVKVKSLVDSTEAVVEGYYARYQAGEMTEEDAKARALKVIKTMRYEGDNYFWVNDMDGVMVMHPIKPELNGKDLLNFEDPNGVKLFKEMVEIAQESGSGFVHYHWPKPGVSEPVAKVSYVNSFKPWGWIVGTGTYLDDIYADFRQKLMVVGSSVLAMIVLASFAAFAVSSSIVNPLKKTTESMTKLADGNLDAEIPSADRQDEIGKINQALSVFKTNALDRSRMEQQQKEREHQLEEEKRQAMFQLANAFEQEVGEVVETVSKAALEMTQMAEKMSGVSEEASTMSTAVAAAATEASTNVEAVASAAEELGKSIQQIAEQVSKSSQITGIASDKASSANDEVGSLVEAAERIGEVVSLISDIAGQTNLLALNATIEAARAGEAGKGFAVVAGEVKSLASQTARATEEISQQINGIQLATNHAASSIKEISGTVGEVNDIAGAIAAAVEEQGAATQEIAHNVSQASAGTQEVTCNINGVNESVGQTKASSIEVLNLSKDLASQSDYLKQKVQDFLSNIRAA